MYISEHKFTTCLLHTSYINFLHSFHLCCFSCFSELLFINTLTYNWNAWYRSWVKWQCMADEPHEVRISLKCSTNLFCGTCNALWPQYRFFSASFICQQLWGMWTIHFLIVFIHICNLRGLISVFLLIFSHIFVCVSFSSKVGVVIWRARWAPFPHGEASSLILVQKSFFEVCILLYPPKTFFQHH